MQTNTTLNSGKKPGKITRRFDHIKATIPGTIQARMRALALLARDDLINDFGGFRECATKAEKVDDISGVPFDGFIPFQDGGFNLTAFYSQSCDASHNFSQEQTEFNESVYNSQRDQFARDNDLDPNFQYHELTDELQAVFDEYECNLFESAPLTFDVYACSELPGAYHWGNKPGVTIRLSINFKDAEYGRDKYASTLKEVNYSFAEFAKLRGPELQEIIKSFQNYETDGV
jgi:hypothetical protein